MKEVQYTKIEVGKGVSKKTGLSVLDGEVRVYVNDKKPFKMTLLPRNKVEAALGRIFFMGIISSFEDVLEIDEEGDLVRFTVNENERELSCVDSDVILPAHVLSDSMKKLFGSTDVWRLTGGVHSAGLFDFEGNLLYNTDDIGKGNAIDAVIGMGLRESLDFSKCILVSTGRQIGFMVEKAVRAGIPIVAARGAPLYSSIEVAKEYGITLVCFVKGKSMNIYTHESRVIIE